MQCSDFDSVTELAWVISILLPGFELRFDIKYVPAVLGKYRNDPKFSDR